MRGAAAILLVAGVATIRLLLRRQKSTSEVLALLDKRAPRGRRRIGGECTFCLESVGPRQCTRLTTCGHIFHARCLEKWVEYSAERFLDAHRHSVAEDGEIRSSARPPSCPNCSADLGVVPVKALRKTIITAIANSLAVTDFAAAEEIIGSGVVAVPGRSVETSSYTPGIAPVDTWQPASFFAIARTTPITHPAHVSIADTISADIVQQRVVSVHAA